MLYRYDGKTFEFAGVVVENDDSNVIIDKSNTTDVNPFDESGLKVTGNYFDPVKKVWYNKSRPVDTTQESIALLAQQLVALTNQNKTLQREVATLAEQAVKNKGGN